MIYRNFEKEDTDSILELFKLSFGKEMDRKFWNWRYMKNVLGKIMIYLAMDNDKIAAHYALSPTKIFVLGTEISSGLSMTTMTHPDYRRQGLFTKLAKELYDKSKSDLEVIYGVPNDNSINGFKEYLDFNHINDIPVFEIDLKEKVTPSNTEEYKNIVNIKKFDQRFDDLFENLKVKYDIILSRTSEYLNWRFFENPINDYTVLAHLDNDSISGYVVMKEFNNGKDRIGDIVDIVALDHKSFSALINEAIKFFNKKNISIVKIWMNDPEFIENLKEIGFCENEEKYHFIVKNNSEKNLKILEDYSKWYLTMSDIDIF